MIPGADVCAAAAATDFPLWLNWALNAFLLVAFSVLFAAIGYLEGKMR